MEYSEVVLNIGGFVPLSTIDYPNALAAVIFCQGCSWRCRYCHNPGLLSTTETQKFQWPEVLSFLRQRQGLLDAVVFSGGEPTLQAALLPAIQQVRSLGYQIGLHSAGSAPRRLMQVLPYVDWVGLDIKALEADYPAVTGVSGSGKAAWQSAQQVISNCPQYEIRITLHPDLLPVTALDGVLDRLKKLGAKHIVLQPCGTNIVLDPALRNTCVDLETYQTLLNLHAEHVRIRS
jgi:pyruvate formate lyase activating enzyme